MALSFEQEDNRFTAEWQGPFTISLPDTSSNRKAILVFLRSLHDSSGKHMFTFQELSVLFDSNNRQASSQHMEDFRDCGSDFLDYLTRKRKVDNSVVETLDYELRCDPLAKLTELSERVNTRLGREDLTEANMKVAMEQIPYQQIRNALLKQLAKGEAHYQEEYLLGEMMESAHAISMGQRAGIRIPETDSMIISDPTSIRSLVTPDIPTSSLKDSLKWVVFCMVLYFYGVPLSVLVLQRWFGYSRQS